MRAALVGCGSIAQVHAQVLADLPETTLAACMDILPERARALAQKTGAEPYGELERMLDEVHPDVLHICTPHVFHTPMARAAAQRGIAVFTEKPPVISREQWAEFQKLGALAPVGICFQNRYNDSVQFILELIRSGRLGKLLGGRAFVTWKRGAAYYTESGWRGMLATEGGGALINQAVHTLDLLVQFFGKPDWTDASLSNHHLRNIIEVEDTLEAYIEFSGAPVSFYATTAHCADSPVFVELCAERATVRMEETCVTVLWKDGTLESRDFAQEPALGKAYWGSGHAHCIADFYECLKQHREFPISIAQVSDTVELLLGIYESAREHHAVQFIDEG